MSTIDWDQVHERLERGRRSAGERTEAEARALLEQRAQALARPPAEEGTDGDTLDVVVVAIAGARYGIDAHCIVEALELGELTVVPCTPPWLLGVVNHRGRVLPVFDLARLLAAPIGEYDWIVAVDAGGITFGIAVQSVEEAVRLELSALAAAPGGPVRGVMRDHLTVLDLDALAADPRLHIEDSELP